MTITSKLLLSFSINFLSNLLLVQYKYLQSLLSIYLYIMQNDTSSEESSDREMEVDDEIPRRRVRGMYIPIKPFESPEEKEEEWSVERCKVQQQLAKTTAELSVIRSYYSFDNEFVQGRLRDDSFYDTLDAMVQYPLTFHEEATDVDDDLVSLIHDAFHSRQAHFFKLVDYCSALIEFWTDKGKADAIAYIEAEYHIIYDMPQFT